MTPSELETIFINLEEIIPVNSRFLKYECVFYFVVYKFSKLNIYFQSALNKRIDEARQNNQTPRIGDIFNEHVSVLYFKFKLKKKLICLLSSCQK